MPDHLEGKNCKELCTWGTKELVRMLIAPMCGWQKSGLSVVMNEKRIHI